MLISTPALRALKKHFAGSKLYLLVAGRVAGITRDLAYVDKVFVFEPEHPWLKLLPNLKAILELRNLEVDLGINMRTMVSDSSAYKIRWIMDLINPGIKAGRDTVQRGNFLDIKIPENDIGGKYEMEYDIDTASALGARVEDKSIDFNIPEKCSGEVHALLVENGLNPDEDILVAVHPGGRPSRRWPAGNYAGLIKKLSEKYPVKFVITGGIEEKSLAEKIIRQSGVKALNLCGRLDIYQLAALLKKCALYITNDTGVMHIAAFIKTPLVAIFGPGDLKRYDPRNISSKAAVLYKKEHCSPCNKFSCPSVKCLRSITIEDVVQSAVNFLEPEEGRICE